jgi:hypothetical protein
MPRDWWVLIDKKAALREQHARLSVLLQERPGCAVDRERQERLAIDNRRSVAGAVYSRTDRELHDIEDADRFIAEMEAKRREAFLARYEQRRAAAA